MQQIDAAAIDTVGIPRLLLMEHAGLALARSVDSVAASRGSAVPRRSQPIVVCCGSGFNGQIIKSHGIKFCGFCGTEITLKSISDNHRA